MNTLKEYIQERIEKLKKERKDNKSIDRESIWRYDKATAWILELNSVLSKIEEIENNK